MAKENITTRWADSVTTDKPQENFFDQTTQGLVLRVSRTGAKQWYFVYRFNGAAPTWLTLGKYPETKLVEARAKASSYRAAVDNHRDPAAEAKAAKLAAAQPQPEPVRGYMFDDFVPVFIAFQKGRKKTWHEDENRIKAVLSPEWGSRELTSIKRADVHALLDKLVAQGIKQGVTRYQMLISRIFTVALDKSRVEYHPCVKMIRRFKPVARDRVLTDAEIRELITKLTGQHPTTSAICIEGAEMTLLRLLTGQRAEELCGMRRDELDLVDDFWTIPASRAKNGHEHVVPLATMAKGVITRRLAALPADVADLFPALASEARRRSSAKSTRHLSKALSRSYDWRDLRRTMSTRLGELGYSSDTIGKILNHAAVSVTDRHYNKHKHTAEKREALDAWNDEIVRVLADKPRTKVLPLVRKAA